MIIDRDTVLAMFYSSGRPGRRTWGAFLGKIRACLQRMAEWDLHDKHVRFSKYDIVMEGAWWCRRLRRVLSHGRNIDLSVAGSYVSRRVR